MFNKKLKGIPLLILSIGIVNAHAQSAAVVAGGNGSGASGSVSFTVGQIDYLASSSAGGSVSQGVQHSFTPSILPITLVDLSARKQTDKILVNWETLSELNSSKFLVQRSKTADGFNTIKQTPAAGHSVLPLKYSAIDDQPFTGLNYYRIAMVDKDGTQVFSKIVSVTFDKKSPVTLVYPNPTKNSFVLKVQDVAYQSGLVYQFYDLNGRLIFSNNIVDTQTTVQVDKLASGTYFLKVLDKENQLIKTFQIIKSN